MDFASPTFYRCMPVAAMSTFNALTYPNSSREDTHHADQHDCHAKKLRIHCIDCRTERLPLQVDATGRAQQVERLGISDKLQQNATACACLNDDGRQKAEHSPAAVCYLHLPGVPASAGQSPVKPGPSMPSYMMSHTKQPVPAKQALNDVLRHSGPY